jgi:hypothetical protein
MFARLALVLVLVRAGAPPVTPIVATTSIDLCGDAIDLAPGATVTGMMVKKYAGYIPCFGYTHETLTRATVYKIKATEAATYKASLFRNGDEEIYVSVFQGCPPRSTTRSFTLPDGHGRGLQVDPEASVVVSTSMGCVSDHFQSGARWSAVPGETYFLVVHTFSNLNTGNHALSLDKVTSVSTCDADLTDLGRTIESKALIAYASAAHQAPFLNDFVQCTDVCAAEDHTLFIATIADAHVQAQVFVEGETDVSVYTGDCSTGWSCLATGEPRFGTMRFQFDNEVPNTTYLVAVSHCYKGTTEDFRLTVKTDRYGDVCKDSKRVSLPFSEASSLATNHHPYKDLISCDGNRIQGAVALFSFIGNGDKVLAFVNETDAFDQAPHLAFYNASCTHPFSCLVQDEFGRLFVSMDTTKGVSYNLAVFNDFESTNKYRVTIKSLVTGHVCEDLKDAFDLGVFNTTRSTRLAGSTVDASLYRGLPCLHDLIESPTRFYSFTAGRAGQVTTSLRSTGPEYFDAELSPLVAGSPCKNVACRSDYAWGNLDEVSETKTWAVKAFETHYFAIHARDTQPTSSGHFVADVNFTAFGSFCNDAFDIGVLSDMNFTGSTFGANIYNDFLSCDNRTITSPSRVYSFTTETAGFVTAWARSTSGPDFSPRFTPLAGSSCETNLLCPLDATSEYVDVGVEAVTWEVKARETYFLVVADSDISFSGDFAAALKFAPHGIFCNDAIPLREEKITQAGWSINGAASLIYNLNMSCSGRSLSSKAAVYVLETTDEKVLSATVRSTEINPYVDVFRIDGDCNTKALVCADPTSSTAATWQAEANATYYIVVGDCCGSTGEAFTLTIKTVATTSMCDSKGITALNTIPSEGRAVSDSTSSGHVFNDIGLCGNDHSDPIPGRGRAYTVRGDGNTLLTSFQDTSGFGARVAIYAGACDALRCSTNKTYSTSDQILLHTKVNKTYTFLVDACCGQVGDFTMRIEPVVSGHIFKDAKALAPTGTGYFTSGSIDNDSAYYSGLPLCNEEMKGRGVVYRVNGSNLTRNKILTASVTGFGIDPQIAAYKKDSNDNPVCVDNHEFRRASWTSIDGDLVYILVFASYEPRVLPLTGPFALRIETSIPAGSTCDTTVDFKKDSAYSGTTENGSTSTGAPDCNNIDDNGVVAPSVLHRVVGDGTVMTASVFTPNTCKFNGCSCSHSPHVEQ